MAAHPSVWPFVAMVVIIVAAAGGAAGVVAYLNPVHHPVPVLTVEEGDNVTVNYIGSFASGPQLGKVFDTSLYPVATDNFTYPKSLEFSLRGGASAYTWLPVHVGSSTPSGGYVLHNYTFGTVIPGFWTGMIGMTGNTSRTVVIPVDQAYGPGNPACVQSQPLVFTLPVYVSMPRTTFESTYPHVVPVTGGTFTDPIYSWTDSILSANGSWVSFQRLPAPGQATHPDGLPYYVSAITSQSLTITSRLSVGDAGKVLGTLPGNQTFCSSHPSSRFIVSSIDWAQGTFSWDFNPEVDGQSLQFVITVTNIFPPS